MKIKVIIHEAEEGGYWAEVPAIPGCATQGETFEELLKNLYEAVDGCLACFPSFPSCAWERIKEPSSAWHQLSFPSATWERVK